MSTPHKKSAKRASAQNSSAALVAELQPPTKAVQKRNGEMTWTFDLMFDEVVLLLWGEAEATTLPLCF